MDRIKRFRLINMGFVLASSLMLNACGTDDDNDNSPIVETQTLDGIRSVGYVYHAESGNRLVRGQSDLASLTPIDIPLPASATWIVSAPVAQESIWAVVLSNAEVKAFKVNGQGYEEVPISPNQLSKVVSPTLIVENTGAVKLANIFDNASIHSAPVILDKTNGDRVYIADNGDVVLKTVTGEQRLAVNALNYARLLLDDNKRMLVLSQPTSRYDHLAVLGSAYQHAAAITLIETQPEFKIIKTISIDTPDVVEGNALIWEDVNNDGQREIITTLSNTSGARIVVYNEDGSEYGVSTAIGINHRWRHQIAVAPFKAVNETHLVSVYIPHLGPNIEYFRLDDASMSITSEAVSYSSHLFTGLNIDMSLTGDFDNDGQLEIMLVERNDRKELAAFSYTDNGMQLDWRLPLTNPISSNAAAVTLGDNTLAYGVGQGNSLRIWHP